MKKISSFILRISITGVLLILLFSKINLKVLGGILVHADLVFFGLAFVLFGLLNLLVSERWRLLLTGLGLEAKGERILLSYMASLFINLIFPSTVGGDAVRTMDIAGHTKRPSSAILATVLLDRLSGFFGLITVLILALIFGYRVINDTRILWAGLVLVLVLVFLTGVMFSGRVFGSVVGFLSAGKIKSYLTQIHAAASGYARKKRILFKIWFYSLLIHAGMSGVYYLTARGLGLHVSFVYFLLVVPVLTVFSAMPISVGGLGVRDTASVVIFAKVGVAAEKALALSLANFGFLFILGILGGIAYVLNLSRRRL